MGKLTTAKLLAEKLEYKLLHNHLTTDLVRAIFDRGNPTGSMLIVKLRLEMLEAAVKEKIKGLIITGVYASDFMYPNGKTDEWFVKEIERIVTGNGGEFYAVNLVTGKETLMKRVVEEDRRQWKKIHDPQTLEDVLNKNDFATVAPVEHNIVIENTSLSAKQVVEKIADFIK